MQLAASSIDSLLPSISMGLQPAKVPLALCIALTSLTAKARLRTLGGAAMTPKTGFHAAVRQALSSVPQPYRTDDVEAGDALTEWLRETPPNAAQLEFEALRRRFALRRQLLAHTIGTAEVNELLATGSRQTVHDRLKAGTLLGILDQGKWRFPLWQFDPDGPNSVIDGLAQVLQALQVSNLAKARWLQKPHSDFGGATPLDLLRQGRLDDVLAEAFQVGRGQD
jgi:hypothetical protein